MDVINLVLSAEREISFPTEELAKLRATAPGFPYKLDPASAKALQSRLRALRKSSADVRFTIAGLDFHQIPETYESNGPRLKLILDGDDCYIILSPERAEILHDMIVASQSEHGGQSLLECPIYSRTLKEEREAEADRELWEERKDFVPIPFETEDLSKDRRQ